MSKVVIKKLVLIQGEVIEDQPYESSLRSG